MVAEISALVALVTLVDRMPRRAAPAGPRRPGRPPVHSDRLCLQALVSMIVKHLATVNALLGVLAEPAAEMRQLRALLSEGGQYPSPRTFPRRLGAVPASLPAQIGCLGRHLVATLAPWADDGRAGALMLGEQ